MDNVHGNPVHNAGNAGAPRQQGLFGGYQVDIGEAPMAMAKAEGKTPSFLTRIAAKITGTNLLRFAAYDPSSTVEAFKKVYEQPTREKQREALKVAMGQLANEYPKAERLGYGPGLLKEVSDMMGLHGMAPDPSRLADPDQLVTNMHFFYNLSMELYNDHFDPGSDTSLTPLQQVGHGMIQGIANNTLNNLIEHNAAVIEKYIPAGTDPRDALVLLMGTMDINIQGAPRTVRNYPPGTIQAYYSLAYPNATDQQRQDLWENDVVQGTGPYRDPKTFSHIEIQWLKKSVPIDRMKDFVEKKGGSRAEIIDWTRTRRKTTTQPQQRRATQQAEPVKVPTFHDDLYGYDPHASYHEWEEDVYDDDDDDEFLGPFGFNQVDDDVIAPPVIDVEDVEDDVDVSPDRKDKDIETIKFPSFDDDDLDFDDVKPDPFVPFPLPSSQLPKAQQASLSEGSKLQPKIAVLSQIEQPQFSQGAFSASSHQFQKLHSARVDISTSFDPEQGPREAYEQYIPRVPKNAIAELYETKGKVDPKAVRDDIAKHPGRITLEYMESKPEIYGNPMEQFSPQDFFDRIPPHLRMHMLSPISIGGIDKTGDSALNPLDNVAAFRTITGLNILDEDFDALKSTEDPANKGQSYLQSNIAKLADEARAIEDRQALLDGLITDLQGNAGIDDEVDIPIIEEDEVDRELRVSGEKKTSFLGALGADGDDPEGIQRLLEVTIRDYYDNAHDDKNLANGFRDIFGINLMLLRGKVDKNRLSEVPESQLAVMLAIAKDQPVVVIDEISGTATAYIPAEKDEKHPYQLPQKVEGSTQDILDQVGNPICIVHNSETGTWQSAQY